MTLKFFYDFLSQPSRALYIFFKINKVPFELHPVALRKGEHLTDEFKEKYSRFQKVPFIHDDNFKLNESIAILRYVTNKYRVSSNLYPIDDIEKRARIDEYLEWQHNNTRAYCAMYFMKKWLQPRLTGAEPNPKSLESTKDGMENCLNQIENLWLKDTKFLCGNEITIADVFAACEIEQPRMAQYSPSEGRPKLKAWLDNVREATHPYYEEAHKILNKIAGDPKAKL